MLRLEWFEWTDDGYPTEGSLGRLERELKEADIFRAMELFYAALRENYYSDAVGETEVEVRGEPTRVWGYHTMGWIGNEDIIETCAPETPDFNPGRKARASPPLVVAV